MQRSPIRWLPRILRSLRLPLPAALVSILVSAVAFAQGNGKLQIHHINVGQGDGMLLISPNGETALFDDGVYTNCNPIVTYLQGLGITSVKYHFASHYHADHIGCIDDLAAVNITVDVAGYDRGYSYSSATFTNYVNTLGNKRTTIAKNQTLTLDGGAANPVFLKCVDLNGAGVYSPTGSDENAKSVVMLVSYGNFNEVIGGDLTGSTSQGNDVETTVGPEVGDVEVYKVHHHGSTYSSNDNWLNATTPEVGIIQVGNNSYGHPTAGALGRLHAHGVHTYWNQTGSGASPDPQWDRVANGEIVVQADPGPGAAYTVSGPGFADTYYNDGATPPLTETLAATSMTMIKGSITVGDVTRLAANDAVRVSVSAGVDGGKYLTDWYGSVTLNHPPLNLTITYDGNYTISRSQTLYLWNWSTSAWNQVDQATVGTTDVTRTWSTTSPASYVSPTRELRLRVGANKRNSSYTCRGDLMSFTYDYIQGTIATRPVTDLMASPPAASEASGPDRETEAMHQAPQRELSRLEALPSAGAVTLTWATDLNAHLDGFNVYRESADGERVFVGGEAVLETTRDEVVFRFVDESPDAGSVVYWLGARSCSGSEGVIGPIRVTAAPKLVPGALGFGAVPNPARGSMQFRIEAGSETPLRLDVFDLAGRRVATPFAGRATPGNTTVEWRLAHDDGRRIPSGIYFARLEGSGRTLLRRVTVLDR